jgi:hypothetical protein
MKELAKTFEQHTERERAEERHKALGQHISREGEARELGAVYGGRGRGEELVMDWIGRERERGEKWVEMDRENWSSREERGGGRGRGRGRDSRCQKKNPGGCCWRSLWKISTEPSRRRRCISRCRCVSCI